MDPAPDLFDDAEEQIDPGKLEMKECGTPISHDRVRYRVCHVVVKYRVKKSFFCRGIKFYLEQIGLIESRNPPLRMCGN